MEWNYDSIERVYLEGEVDRIEAFAWEFKDNRKKADMRISVDEAIGEFYLGRIKELLDKQKGEGSQSFSCAISPRNTEELWKVYHALSIDGYFSKTRAA
jgi:hypothetical protein